MVLSSVYLLSVSNVLLHYWGRHSYLSRVKTIDCNMSILMESEDLNEWSLFGGQLELVNIDAGNLTMTDSWSECTPDSLEMADNDIDDIGITSSFKVVSCPADGVGQFINCKQQLTV